MFRAHPRHCRCCQPPLHHLDHHLATAPTPNPSPPTEAWLRSFLRPQKTTSSTARSCSRKRRMMANNSSSYPTALRWRSKPWQRCAYSSDRDVSSSPCEAKTWVCGRCRGCYARLPRNSAQVSWIHFPTGFSGGAAVREDRRGVVRRVMLGCSIIPSSVNL